MNEVLQAYERAKKAHDYLNRMPDELLSQINKLEEKSSLNQAWLDLTPPHEVEESFLEQYSETLHDWTMSAQRLIQFVAQIAAERASTGPRLYASTEGVEMLEDIDESPFVTTQYHWPWADPKKKKKKEEESTIFTTRNIIIGGAVAAGAIYFGSKALNKDR